MQSNPNCNRIIYLGCKKKWKWRDNRCSFFYNQTLNIFFLECNWSLICFRLFYFLCFFPHTPGLFKAENLCALPSFTFLRKLSHYILSYPIPSHVPRTPVRWIATLVGWSNETYVLPFEKVVVFAKKVCCNKQPLGEFRQ